MDKYSWIINIVDNKHSSKYLIKFGVHNFYFSNYVDSIFPNRNMHIYKIIFLGI